MAVRNTNSADTSIGCTVDLRNKMVAVIADDWLYRAECDLAVLPADALRIRLSSSLPWKKQTDVRPIEIFCNSYPNCKLCSSTNLTGRHKTLMPRSGNRGGG
jgi:hypothetical protein